MVMVSMGIMMDLGHTHTHITPEFSNTQVVYHNLLVMVSAHENVSHNAHQRLLVFVGHCVVICGIVFKL
jgi:hypothetical protein